MAIYTKPARQMLVDLINESNPDLPFEINTTDYDFTDPKAIDQNEQGHNTEIRLIAKPSAPYVGNRLLTYRRLNLAYLFRNMTPVVRQWVENGGNPSSGTIRATLHQFLPLFSQKYGILLETSQIRQVDLAERDGLDPTRRFSIQAENNSLVFVGSVQAQWVLGRRRLSELLQIDEVEGRKYPDYTDERPLLTPLTHHIDFTLYAQENGNDWDTNDTRTLIRESYRRTTSGGIVNDTTVFNRENRYRQILDALLRTHFGFGMNVFDPVPGGSWGRSENSYRVVNNDPEKIVNLAGIPFRTITLPHPEFPEANSEFFNHAIVFIIPEDCPWGIGNIFFHYNR